MLDPNAISQFVGVMLMLAPSSTDNHVENYSKPLLMFKTVVVCEKNAASVNDQQIIALTPDTNEENIIYAWCDPQWR